MLSDLKYADNRVNQVCRAAALAVLSRFKVLEQVSRDTYRVGNQLLRVKTSNRTHLTEGQHFWGGEKPERCADFVAMAERMGLQPLYVLVVPDSDRLGREELASREEPLPIPCSAHFGLIGGVDLLEFMRNRPLTESGQVHLWLVGPSIDDVKLTASPTGDHADGMQLHMEQVEITDKIRESVRGGGGVFQANRSDSKAKVPKRMLLQPGTKYAVNLVVSGVRITGDITITQL